MQEEYFSVEEIPANRFKLFLAFHISQAMSSETDSVRQRSPALCSTISDFPLSVNSVLVMVLAVALIFVSSDF